VFVFQLISEIEEAYGSEKNRLSVTDAIHFDEETITDTTGN